MFLPIILGGLRKAMVCHARVTKEKSPNLRRSFFFKRSHFRYYAVFLAAPLSRNIPHLGNFRPPSPWTVLLRRTGHLCVLPLPQECPPKQSQPKPDPPDQRK